MSVTKAGVTKVNVFNVIKTRWESNKEANDALQRILPAVLADL